MKITFIIEGMADAFFEGREAFGPMPATVGLNNYANNRERLAFLTKYATDGLVKMKVGNGSFGDRVELNQILRTDRQPQYEIGKRRGYILATFTF